jgi:eukaryotic-like serine/threonine-protein kinase
MSESHTTVDDSLPQSLLERVDAICDRFEDAWLNGTRPRIEDYLAEGTDERERIALLKQLVALDIAHRRRQGEAPSARDYQCFSSLPAGWLADTVNADGALSARYQFGERIGIGGTGEVRKGRDRRLDRDLAMKILREEHQGQAHLQQRFLEEARIGGRLQHPGIVPVHDLGELSDARPFFTMKLVEGRTLAALLAERSSPSQDLPRFLTIFEQICQTLAYAHAQGVIHRDLKPLNVMVGAFGEVQVMDWGLAKVLRRGRAGEAAAERDTVLYGSTEEEDTAWQMRTQSGQAMGTLSYVPPEQARGEVKRMDECSDVFGLGAILCEILTGHPPFSGHDRSHFLAKAKACDHAEALARLEACGADTELLHLAKACLAAEPGDRPRNAGAVAEEVKSYLAGVQERLRAAERERAAAQARAEEARKTAAAEQRARRRMVWAALAVLLLIVSAGSGAWWHQWKQDQADQAVEKGLAQAETLETEARKAPLEAGKYHLALEAARVAKKLAHGASAKVRGRAEELVARLEREEAAAERDRRLLAALLEVHEPREGPKFRLDEKREMMMEVAERTAEEQFATAFHDWGLDVDATPTAEAAARLKARPAAVVTEVIAALDEWASQRRRDRKREAARRLAELATALEDHPGSLRRDLREILARGQLPVERALGVLSAALRPVPVPVELPLGPDRARLRQLAEKVDPTSEPLLGLLTLTRALRVAGEEALAERLLRTALTARAQEVVLYHTMGQLLTEQTPPRWAEAVEFYRAAWALRPELGVGLANALRHSGHTDEGLALLDRMVRERPDNPYLLFQQGFALAEQGKVAEAEAAWRKALALKPDDAEAHCNLGYALRGQGKHVEAEAAYRKAIALKPDLAMAYNNLGAGLNGQGKRVEAEAACRKAIMLQPDLAMAYSNLGNALHGQGKHVEAEAACRKAIALKPDLAMAYTNLGVALDDQGKHVEGEAAYRKAIALKPDLAIAYSNLGAALNGQIKFAEAEAAYRKAIVLKPDYAEAHCNLGFVLQRQGRFAESLAACRRGHELGSKRSGWRYPSLQWVRTAERLVELDKKLPAVLQGETAPANAGEAVAIAWMCQQPYQKRYAASARLYADAFAEPKLATNLNQQHRYNAARSAALAAAGQGEDARLLPDKVVVMFRRWALAWLRDDLTAYNKIDPQNNAAAKRAIRLRLTHWQHDPDLASLRDKEAVDKLPEAERDACRKLWADVATLLQRTQEK